MAYLDDFCHHTLTFLEQNVVYVIVPKETHGRLDVVVEPRDPAMNCSNIHVGVVNGVVSGGVYRLRKRRDTDRLGLHAFFCSYEQNTTKSLTLSNYAGWMFTPTMNGCTLGVGSQGPGTQGVVRVTHVNQAQMALPGTRVEGFTGLGAQRRMQAYLALGEVGQDGMLVEPESYMGADSSMHATTFGYHDQNQPWTFKSLSYRLGQGMAFHGGINNYP